MTPHRGAILLELLIAMALFIGAAAIAYSVTADAHRALGDAWRRQQAIDVARSRMAELEAGLITLADLRGGGAPPIGSTERAATGAPEIDEEWVIAVETERSAYSGLTLVELTVSEPVPGWGAAPPPGAEASGLEVTLRQLVRLRGDDGEPFELDDIARERSVGDPAPAFEGDAP